MDEETLQPRTGSIDPVRHRFRFRTVRIHACNIISANIRSITPITFKHWKSAFRIYCHVSDDALALSTFSNAEAAPV